MSESLLGTSERLRGALPPQNPNPSSASPGNFVTLIEDL